MPPPHAVSFEVDEAEFLVEGDGFWLRVDDDAEAAELVSHAVREHEDGAQKRTANTTPLRPFINGEPRQAEHGKWVLRQLLAPRHGELRDDDFGGRDGDEANDRSVLDRDIRRTDVVAELILSSVALEEPVEVGLAAELSPPAFDVLFDRASRAADREPSVPLGAFRLRQIRKLHVGMVGGDAVVKVDHRSTATAAARV